MSNLVVEVTKTLDNQSTEKNATTITWVAKGLASSCQIEHYYFVKIVQDDIELSNSAVPETRYSQKEALYGNVVISVTSVFFEKWNRI